MEEIDHTYYKLQPAKFVDVFSVITEDASATNTRAVVINAHTFAPCIAATYHDTILNYGWTIADFNNTLEKIWLTIE
jgi:hypothetical protein